MPEAHYRFKRQAFLDSLADGYSASYSARSAGVTRQYVYHLRSLDPQFAADWDDALEQGGDWGEDRLRDRIVKGDTIATIVHLKMRKRFIENPAIQIQTNVQVEAARSTDGALQAYSVEQIQALIDHMRDGPVEVKALPPGEA